MHDALEMSEDRHARLALHALDKALAAARHDHVERSAQPLQHLADRLAGGEGRAGDRGFRQAGFDEAGDQAGVNRGGGMEAIGAAAQNHRIAAFEAERARIRRHVRPAFVDHADDAERRRDTLDPQPVRPLESRQHAPDRIGQCRDLFDAARHGLDARLVEREPIEESWRQSARFRLGQIAGIGGQDFTRTLAQLPSPGEQRPRLRLGRRIGDNPSGGARGGADFAHGGADVGILGADGGEAGHGASVGCELKRPLSTSERGLEPLPPPTAPSAGSASNAGPADSPANR